ncbi:hypothetical protein HPB52_008881 [Rhipicephalus sanguineus]|uniref:Uncharacterized protein n=1 Tax=Rhipicephalus sanguineus TaxID=34632 RepID=A0A9D4PIM4_RHISA|nr:hypothetical protein HPB52_008881 [Rhipicephalus sanguineus]
MECTVTGTELHPTAFNPDEWKEVLDARKKHHKQKSKTDALSRAENASVAVEPQLVRQDSVQTPAEKLGTTASAARHRRGPIPQLPTDDFKVVYNPNAGVNMAAFTERELRAALLESSGLVESCTQGDLTRTNLVKNVFTMSTACHERVAKYAQIRQITLRGKKIEVNAYIAPPDRAIQGIIYRAYNGESPQEILRELRRSNPLLPIVQARDMGRTSKSVLIHFMSDTLPESVKFFGSVFGVYSFRPKQCSPICIACGGDHRTGDRLCRRKYQRGTTERTRTSTPHQQQTTPDFQVDQASFPPLTSATGEGRTGSKSPRRNTPPMLPTVNQDSQKVSCVDSVSHHSNSRSDSRDLYYQSTIDRLTKENQDLKRQMSLILERLNALTHVKSAQPTTCQEPVEIRDSLHTDSGDHSEIHHSLAEDCPPRKKRTLESTSDVSDTSAQALEAHINKVEQRMDHGFAQIVERFARLEQVITDLTTKLLAPAPPPVPPPVPS